MYVYEYMCVVVCDMYERVCINFFSVYDINFI